jgi:hypothetical protein
MAVTESHKHRMGSRVCGVCGRRHLRTENCAGTLAYVEGGVDEVARVPKWLWRLAERQRPTRARRVR